MWDKTSWKILDDLKHKKEEKVGEDFEIQVPISGLVFPSQANMIDRATIETSVAMQKLLIISYQSWKNYKYQSKNPSWTIPAKYIIHETEI